MSDNIPQELRYTKTHEWVRQENDGSVTIGITDHAQALLGDMVYVELPDLEKVVELDAEIAVVESVKAASDVYAPVAGKIIASNDTLQTQPELVNQDPYHGGWLCRIHPSDTTALAGLLTAAEYQQICLET